MANEQADLNQLTTRSSKENQHSHRIIWSVMSTSIDFGHQAQHLVLEYENIFVTAKCLTACSVILLLDFAYADLQVAGQKPKTWVIYCSGHISCCLNALNTCLRDCPYADVT